MDISATDRNPEPGDNPLLFSTDSRGSFRCTQPQTVMHTTKPLLNQLGTTGICPHRNNQPTQDSNPGPSDHESQTLCVSPPNEDFMPMVIKHHNNDNNQQVYGKNRHEGCRGHRIIYNNVSTSLCCLVIFSHYAL